MNCNAEKKIRWEQTVLDETDLLNLRKELNETAESCTRCLKELTERLKEIKDIEPCLKEEFLLKFLRIAKFDCSKALQRVQFFYEYQDKYLDVFKNCFFSASEIPNFHHMMAVPYRLKNNSMLLIGHGGILDYSKIAFEERIYMELLVFNHLLANPVNQMAGISIIVDCEGFKLRSALAHTPNMLYLYANILQRVIPMRIKACHIVNAPAIFTIVFNLAYPLLSQKNKSRLFNHSNWDTLHALIPPEFLPTQYGGYLKKTSVSDLLENPEELENAFCQQFKFGYLKTKHRREQIMRTLREKLDKSTK